MTTRESWNHWAKDLADQPGKAMFTLTPGQTFYEGPGDVHTVGRNASKTKPAKFVVVLVKKKGVDAVLPAE
jgi:quercetin dioxygenase-like cupin family protein